MAALRTRQRALDARPIKKIAEAKARKKLRATQRLEKAMKKAEGVQDASDLSERAKARQIERVMKKGMSNGKPKKDIKVVVAKGSHRGLKGRPKGVKGRYKMVDSRMKKEVISLQCRLVFSTLLTLFFLRYARRNGKRRRTKRDRGRRGMMY